MIWLLDADMNGTDSYQFLIDAGLVTQIPCPTFGHFDQAIAWLIPNVNPATDVVVLDTIDKMAHTLRGDAKFGTDVSQSVWDKRHLFLDGDKNYLNVYEMAGQMILRRLLNLRATHVRMIITSHESDQIDSQLKKKAPDANAALYKAIKSVTSDMFRMWLLPQNVASADGQSIQYPAGTRMVTMKPNPDSHVKIHVDPFAAEQVPVHIPIENVFVPVLPKVYSYLWKLPSFLCLYGEAGVGKTSAAVSEAFEMFLYQNYPDRFQQARAYYNQQQRQTYHIHSPHAQQQPA